MKRRMWSASSVAVATVDRAFLTEFFCSMAMAGRMPSISSTSGRSMRSRNCRTYVDIDSTNRRCPSAYSVSKARDDFPDPDGPVRTVSCRWGISTETFLRLCVRAPRMEIVRVGIRRENASGAATLPLRALSHEEKQRQRHVEGDRQADQRVQPPVPHAAAARL